MVGDFPFYHHRLEDGEDNHKISWIFLSTDKIGNPDDELIAKVLQRRTVLKHQIIEELEDL